MNATEKLTLVLIEWIDASRLSDGWMDLGGIPEPYPHRCVTVGFLVSENEHAKILVPTIGDTDHPENSHTYGGMMIPTSGIISQTVLKPVVTTKKTMERLKTSKEHRSAYVASQINIGIPFQIRALRKQREWDQKKLAEDTGMLQPRISAIESPGYGSMTIETLQRLANAFDVALVVKFAPFSELLRSSNRFSPDDFSVPKFEDELEQINRDIIHCVPNCNVRG